MLKEVIIHIGYPKTGTTWLQQGYFPLVNNYYFFGEKQIPRELYIPNYKYENIKYLKDYFSRYEKIIISSESFTGPLNLMYEYPRYFKKIFNRAKIIIFIRNQVDKYVSGYSNYINSGGTLTFNKYLNLKGDNKLFGGEKHKYDKLLNEYYKYFNKNNVYVYLHEDFNENKKNQKTVNRISGFMDTYKNYLESELKKVRQNKINLHM